MEITKNREPIVAVDDWFRLAPPKRGKDYWTPGRSACVIDGYWKHRVKTLLRRVANRFLLLTIDNAWPAARRLSLSEAPGDPSDRNRGR
jgi:hypothetical protein